MTYATGYRPDPIGHSRTPFHHLSAKRTVRTLPLSAYIARFAPPVLDQNDTSSCTGGSTGPAIYAALGAAGSPLPWVPSPHGIYTLGRAIDRFPNANGALSALTDDGAAPNEVMRALREWGVRPMRAPTSTGLLYDCEPSNVNDEPNLDELEEDALALILGEYGITSGGPPRVLELQAALAAGKPVTGAIAGGSPTLQTYTGGVLGAGDRAGG